MLEATVFGIYLSAVLWFEQPLTSGMIAGAGISALARRGSPLEGRGRAPEPLAQAGPAGACAEQPGQAFCERSDKGCPAAEDMLFGHLLCQMQHDRPGCGGQAGAPPRASQPGRASAAQLWSLGPGAGPDHIQPSIQCKRALLGARHLLLGQMLI